MAAGLYTACYSCGALFWAPIASWIIESTGGPNAAFICLGIFFFIGCVIATRFFYEVPAGYQGEAGKNGVAPKPETSLSEKNPRQMLGSPVYYLVLCV